jgi:hypothetical protein
VIEIRPAGQQEVNATPFISPSRVPTTPVTASIAEAHPQPSAEPTQPVTAPKCTDNLTFVSDLSIPDGTVVKPGESLDKRWQVVNSGECNWDKKYRLKLIAGPEMGVPAEQALYPARSGTEATIRMVFTAPNEPGTYRSAFQAFTPDGTAFGDAFFIEVVVEAP